MDENLSKTEQVKRHLIKYGKLSEVDAFRLYGVRSLHRLINNLQVEDPRFNFKSKTTTHINEFKQEIKLKTYSL